MSEPAENEELTEPTATPVPEPDQPTTEETEEEEAHEQETTTTEPAEPETGEGDAGDAGDAGEEPTAQAPAVDEKEIERQFKALTKEAERHAARIGDIMGEDSQFLETCPRCVTTDPQRPATPGFIWPVSMVPLLPDDKAAVKLSIGEGVEVEYKSAEDAFVCPKCDGRGKVKSGSKVPGQEKLGCLDCDGYGWIGPRKHREKTAPPNGVPENEPVLVGANDGPPEQDPWGRLRDDLLYGVMPGFERD